MSDSQGFIDHPLQGKKLLIFDVDGTLRDCTVPNQPCPNNPDEWAIAPFVVDTLKLYKWSMTQCQLALVTNQGGIQGGYITDATCQELLRLLMYHLALQVQLPADVQRMMQKFIQYCPHIPERGCYCRKPSPYMLLNCVKGFFPVIAMLKLSDVVYVGNMESDKECAGNAGIDFIWAKDFFHG